MGRTTIPSVWNAGHYEQRTRGGVVTLLNQELTDWDLRGVPVNEVLTFRHLLHTFITLKQFQATRYENKLSSQVQVFIYEA